MNVRLEYEGGIAVAALSGELNAESAASLTETLRDCAATPGTALVVDLSAVSLVDSSGLSALVNLVTRARVSNARVVLVGPSPFVAGVLSTTRLDSWFEICNDLAEARQLLSE